MEERSQIFVGGKLVDSSATARIEVVSPNTEESGIGPELGPEGIAPDPESQAIILPAG